MNNLTSMVLTKSLYLKTFCVLASLFILNVLFAQDINKRKTLKQARKAFYKENYVESQNSYLKLINVEPTNDVYTFEAGLSYYYSTFQQKKSIPLFEAALQNSQEDTIAELFYFLGKAYQLNNEFEKATQMFQKFDRFIDYQSKYGRILKNEVSDEIMHNNNGETLTAKKNTPFFIENVGQGINTKDREYAPVNHPKDKIILFTSRRKINGNKLDKGDLLPYEDIYAAKKTDNGWVLITDQNELKKYLPENVNTKKHDASITYSLDGTAIYTYKKNAVWQSTFENGAWKPLSKLKDQINASQFNVPSVTISSDGKTMFFVTIKKSGFGGKDIYKSVKQQNGEWDAPTILSNNINTNEDEDAPYLTADGKTLYFSSRGQDGMGGYDIYKSTLIDGEWSKAENMGAPFNSPADDIFFNIEETGKKGFFSSNRIDGFGDYDLYSFSTECKNIENTKIRGIVYNNTFNKPVQATLTLTNLTTKNIEYTSTSSIKNGKFVITAKPQSNYQLAIEAIGFQKQNIVISTPKQCEPFSLFSEISLDQVNLNNKNYQIATVRNSFFNRDVLTINATIDTAVQVPDFKDESDTNYQSDIDFMAKSRNFISENTPNFFFIKDTIAINLLANMSANTTTNVNNNNVNTDATIPVFEPIYFDFDKSIINNESKRDLDKIAAYLKLNQDKGVTINITGYTDAKRDLELVKKILAKQNIEFSQEKAEQRSKTYNMALSKSRALAVSNYLKKKGVKDSKIIMDYVGESQPAFPNKNSDGTNNLQNQKRNRRVTFKFSVTNLL